jgi:hypothetical protein
MVSRIGFYKSRIDEIENPWTIDPTRKKGGCKIVEHITRGRVRDGSAFFFDFKQKSARGLNVLGNFPLIGNPFKSIFKCLSPPDPND